MKPTDLAAIQKLPDVAAQLLRQAGFKVDLQAMDWQTLVSRRAKKDPPAQGGWNIFLTAWVAPDIWNPLTNAAIDAARREVRWFGWPTDEQAGEAARPVRARHRRRARRRRSPRRSRCARSRSARTRRSASTCNPLAARKNVTGFVIGTGQHLLEPRRRTER